MTLRLQIVGLVRFSVLSPTFYTQRFQTVDEIAAHLYAPDRMELRFRLFEALCLPSLVGQNDDGFQAVVLTSKRLPTPYWERLQALVEPYSHITCQQFWPSKHYRLLKRGFDTIPPGDATHRVQFRLDDDDCLDNDFIARLRRTAEGLIPLQGDAEPFALCGNRGFYAHRTRMGVQVYDSCEHMPLSAGATIVGKVGQRLNPYRFNHRRFAQHYNTYSDISVPSFVRTVHGDNKSDATQMGLTRRWSRAQIDRALRKHFDLTPDFLNELLA